MAVRYIRARLTPRSFALTSRSRTQPWTDHCSNTAALAISAIATLANVVTKLAISVNAHARDTRARVATLWPSIEKQLQAQMAFSKNLKSGCQKQLKLEVPMVPEEAPTGDTQRLIRLPAAQRLIRLPVSYRRSAVNSSPRFGVCLGDRRAEAPHSHKFRKSSRSSRHTV